MEEHTIESEQLSNGVRVVFIDTDTELTHIRFLFNVGATNEDDTNRGISHLIEHLYFGANKTRTAREFQLELRSLGAEVNASTDSFHTRYYFDVTKANFMSTFDLYLNQLSNFYLEETLLEKEKGVVCQEIDLQQDDPHYVSIYNLLQASFPAHPTSIPVIGYSGILRKLTVEDVTRYYDAYYVSGNLICILVGKFTEEEKIEVKEKLQTFTLGESTGDFLSTENMLQVYQKISRYFKPGLTQNIVKALLPLDGYPLSEAYLASTILGRGLGSFLWEEFREKRSLAYHVSAACWSFDYEHVALFFSTALSNDKDIPEAVNLFKDSIDYLQQIDRTKFEEAKALYTTDFLLSNQKLSNFASEVEDLIYFGCPLTSINYFLNKTRAITFESFQDYTRMVKENMDKFVYTVLLPEPEV